ncbi:MAG: PAC2 family protein [Chloroflexi bacterium]|nr:PAC2 family protein [Chloroflexota bacterium]
MEKDLLKFYSQPELRNPALIIGWNVDAARLGGSVTDYLTTKLACQAFGEIEPVEFFPLGGVTIEDNLVQFPESKFYACPKYDLVVLKSDPPNFEWYKFLNLILDAAEQYCHVKELYTIGGMISLGAHTTPREILGTFDLPEFKDSLRDYNLAVSTEYETPPGQRPTMNSFLLWTAKRRSLPGVSLWVPVPFYLVTGDDPQARKLVIDFFNRRLNLGLDLSDIDEEIKQQNQAIADVRKDFPDIDESITKLESNQRLSAEENQHLAQELEKFLRRRG